MVADKELFDFLDSQGGGFAVVSGDTVVYAGAGARSVLGLDPVGRAAGEIFDAVLLPPSPPGAHGAVRGAWGEVPADSADLGGARILTLKPGPGRETQNAVELFAMALRDALSDGAVTLERLGERFRERGDLEGLTRLSELELTGARVERAVNNLERVLGEDIWRPKMRLLSLEALIRDLARSVGLLTRELGVELKTDIIPENRYFYGDRRLLELALVNLISNSLRAAGPGGTVTVSLGRAGSSAVIRVTDSGSGIAPERLATAFRAHTQPPPLTGGSPGAGLGLSVVQRVAGIHAGAAVIDSRPGAGSGVSLLLPYRDSPDGEFRAPDSEGLMTARELFVELSDVLTPSAAAENREINVY